MFTRRGPLDRRQMYSGEFLVAFVSLLDEAGFEKITVILPHNYESVDPRNPEEEFETFLERDRNFSAVILKARSDARDETMKVLFVNSNGKAIFADDTFPMAESEPNGLFFQSPDPGRAYAVFQYFYDYLRTPSTGRFVLLTLLGLAGSMFLVLEFMAYASKGRGFIQVLGGLPAWDILAMGAAAYFVFTLSAAPTGLWVKPKRELKLIYLLNMALKGQLRDNPVVQVLVTIIGGLVVAYFAKLLGWI